MSSPSSSSATFPQSHSDNQDILITNTNTCRIYSRPPKGKAKRARRGATTDELQCFNDGYADVLYESNVKRAYQNAPLYEDPSGGVFLTQDYTARAAGMRIFAAILLNSWRLRREEAKHLRLKVEYLQSVATKARQQSHVFCNLFRTEKQRNDELTSQLKSSVQSVHDAKCSCETLTTAVLSMRADNALMEQELNLKFRDYDALVAAFGRTKNDLYHALIEQRILDTSLKKESRTVRCIEGQKTQLIDEICELRTENKRVEAKYRRELEKKSEELMRASEKIKFLEGELNVLNEKAKQVDEYTRRDQELQKEIIELHQQVTNLELSIDSSLDTRVRSMWDFLYRYQQRTMQLAHKITHYLLPATPAPPKLVGGSSSSLTN